MGIAIAMKEEAELTRALNAFPPEATGGQA
jgi:hypothetical protein